MDAYNNDMPMTVGNKETHHYYNRERLSEQEAEYNKMLVLSANLSKTRRAYK